MHYSKNTAFQTLSLHIYVLHIFFFSSCSLHIVTNKGIHIYYHMFRNVRVLNAALWRHRRHMCL